MFPEESDRLVRCDAAGTPVAAAKGCFARAERCVEDADRAVVTFERAVPPSLLRAVLVVAFCDRRAGDAPRLPPLRAAELLRELGFGFCVAGEEIGRREESVGSDRAVSMLAEEEEAAAWSRGEAVLRGDDLGGRSEDFGRRTLASPAAVPSRTPSDECRSCRSAKMSRMRLRAGDAPPRLAESGGEVAVLAAVDAAGAFGRGEVLVVGSEEAAAVDVVVFGASAASGDDPIGTPPPRFALAIFLVA